MHTTPNQMRLALIESITGIIYKGNWMFYLSPQNINEQPPSRLNRDKNHFLSSRLFGLMAWYALASQLKVKCLISQVFQVIHAVLPMKEVLKQHSDWLRVSVFWLSFKGQFMVFGVNSCYQSQIALLIINDPSDKLSKTVTLFMD